MFFALRFVTVIIGVLAAVIGVATVTQGAIGWSAAMFAAGVACVALAGWQPTRFMVRAAAVLLNLVVRALFLWFVFPTPWSYYNLDPNGAYGQPRPLPLRRSRITGEIQYMDGSSSHDARPAASK